MNWKQALQTLKQELPGETRQRILDFLQHEVNRGNIDDDAFPEQIDEIYRHTTDISLSTALKELQNRFRSRRILGRDLLRLTAPPPGDAEQARLWKEIHALKSAYEAASARKDDFESLYDLREIIGEGGMSTVFRAVRRADNREVAIKFLRREFFTSPAMIQRFKRECRLSTGFDHPNIIRVLEAGESGGRAFLVMEYLPLGGLDEKLGTPALTPGAAVTIGIQVAGALAHIHSIHSRSVIHRDVKLANLLVAQWPAESGNTGDAGIWIKLTDFGLSKEIPGDGLTGVGVAMGTAGYAAPELKTSAKDADHRADIYALGVCLFRMLSGGEFPDENTPVKGLRWVPRPAGLEKIICKCLEKDRNHRYPSAEALAEALAGIKRKMV